MARTSSVAGALASVMGIFRTKSSMGGPDEAAGSGDTSGRPCRRMTQSCLQLPHSTVWCSKTNMHLGALYPGAPAANRAANGSCMHYACAVVTLLLIVPAQVMAVCPASQPGSPAGYQ